MALAKGCFLTKGVARIGIYAVLCVNVAHVLANQEQCVNGIRLAVKNEVCGVEVNAKVIKTNILNGACEREGSFLTCFKQEVLTVLFAVSGDLAQSDNRLAVELGVGILGNEACVGCDLVNTKLLCKIRTCLQVEDSLETCKGRNDTKGKRTFKSIPNSLAAPTAPNGGDANAVFFERCKNLCYPLVGVACHIPAGELNGVKAHLFYFFDLEINIGILMQIDK